MLHPIPRPWAVAIFAFLAFFGRLAVSNAAADVRKEAKPESKIAASVRAASAKYLPPIGLAVLFIYPFAVLALLGSGGSLKWVDSYGIQILIYVMLGWGLNIVVGLAGLLGPRLRRLLRGRRLFLRAAGDDVRPFLLDLSAARRHPRRALGRHARLSRLAPARRLSRHRHPRLRRNHQVGAGQLGRRSPAAAPASPPSRRSPSSACASPTSPAASTSFSILTIRRCTARYFCIM